MGSGNLNFIENFSDYFVCRDVVCFGLVGDSDAVTENVMANGDYIFGHNISAAMQERVGAGGTGEAD